MKAVCQRGEGDAALSPVFDTATCGPDVETKKPNHKNAFCGLAMIRDARGTIFGEEARGRTERMGSSPEIPLICWISLDRMMLGPTVRFG